MQKTQTDLSLIVCESSKYVKPVQSHFLAVIVCCCLRAVWMQATDIPFARIIACTLMLLPLSVDVSWSVFSPLGVPGLSHKEQMYL